jgi:5-methylcytosine-specific restriction endonuclease McrA
VLDLPDKIISPVYLRLKSKEYEELMGEYYDWRLQIFNRDKYTCRICHEKTTPLNAHHIISLTFIINKYKIKNIIEARKIKELWDINNGITVCVKCHKAIHFGGD